MRLEGWNHVPRGYAAMFDLAAAPWWLRLWFHTPFVDRYAFPRLVRRGLPCLRPHPGFPPAEREPVENGWQLCDPDYVPPGSVRFLR